MTMIIRLSDEQATALEVKAAAQGLSVEQWIQKLAESDNKPPRKVPTSSPPCKPLLTATSTLSRSVIAFLYATFRCNDGVAPGHQHPVGNPALKA